MKNDRLIYESPEAVVLRMYPEQVLAGSFWFDEDEDLDMDNWGWE